MKLNYNLNFIFNITKFDKQKVYQLTDYFSTLPVFGKIEVLYQMKQIEEDEEGAFFQQFFNKAKVGEYRFALFLLAINWLYEFENKTNISKRGRTLYASRKLARLNHLRASEKKNR